MLLHYAIRKIENQAHASQQFFSNLTTQDFDLKKPYSFEKFVYSVLGKDCQHFDSPSDLPDVVKGYNSCAKEYECPYCKKKYTEIEQFSPHLIFLKAKKEINPKAEKITVFQGQILNHLKRDKKRFFDPFSSDNIRQLLLKLLTNNEGQGQLLAVIEKNKQFQESQQLKFTSICLLDNVNIVIPVRHRNCQHVSAYELTSLITYQIEHYEQLTEKLKERESRKYLRCLEQSCKSVFPLTTNQELLQVLVFDFQYSEKIKMAIPGSFDFVATKEYYNEIRVCNKISLNNNYQEDFTRKYWIENSKISFNSISDQFLRDKNLFENQRLDEIKEYFKQKQQFKEKSQNQRLFEIEYVKEKQKFKERSRYEQKFWEQEEKQRTEEVLYEQKLIAEETELKKQIFPLELYTTQEQFQQLVLEKVIAIMNQEPHKKVKEKLNIYKYGSYNVPLKDLCQRNFISDIVEFPARCINCPIEEVKYGEKQLKTMDIRTLIAYILHRQIVSQAQNKQNYQIKCPLCGIAFDRSETDFSFDLIYYDSQLYYRMQQQMKEIMSHPDKIMKYSGNQYLLADFQNKYCYTLQNYQQLMNQENNKIIYFKNSIHVLHPIINFKCQNQQRISLEYFYKVFKINNYKMDLGIKLCSCEECQLVDEIEGQLYYDQIFVQAQRLNKLYLECKYGFQFNIETEQIVEIKQPINQYTKYIPPPLGQIQGLQFN